MQYPDKTSFFKLKPIADGQNTSIQKTTVSNSSQGVMERYKYDLGKPENTLVKNTQEAPTETSSDTPYGGCRW